MNRKLLLFFFFSYFLCSFSATAARDTLTDYSSLRNYSGTIDTIFIDHPRYHGVFYKDSCSGGEDYGTIIGSFVNSGICWKRITNNYFPRFWELGGSAPDGKIGMVIEEVDAINSAAIAAYNAGGDTIIIDTMYEIDRSIFLISNNTYLGIGDSAGFIRKNSPKTVLKEPTQIGDQLIKVQSNVGFRTGQTINIASNQAYDSIAGFVSYNAGLSNLLGVGDSLIYLSGRSIRKVMNAGDSVGLFFAMMRPRFTQLDSVYLKNLVFNGNRSSYTLNYDWRVATTIMLSSTFESTVEDCRFYETTTENLFLCGATFKNCYGEGLNGSILHFSCQPRNYTTNVLYNHFKNVNEVPDSIIAHSEGGFTFSAKVRNLRLAYNTVENIGEHGVGTFTHDDYNNEITDNLLNTDKEEVMYIFSYSAQDSNKVYNNKNQNKADTSSANCFIRTPVVRGVNACAGNSSSANPLLLSDTLSITLDSLTVINSNENFLKCIIPIYDSSFFKLENIEVTTPGLSQHHQWLYNDTSSVCRESVVFDNGHRNGLFGKGNWGYEGCGDSLACNNIKIDFVVNNLPRSGQPVACPLKEIEVRYDSEAGTWEDSVFCTTRRVTLDTTQLGSPILDVKITTNINEANLSGSDQPVKIYPNPANDLINVSVPSGYYRIMSSIGNTIEQGTYTNNQIKLDGLFNGVYFLVISTDELLYKRVFIRNDNY